jgi:hypothetical protein
MGQGQGSITVHQKGQTGNPGPPFVIGSANNGLSIDPITGRIVLGQAIGTAGNPARFLSNREIPMNGFSFLMQNAGNTKFFIDPINDTFEFGDFNAQTHGSFFAIDNLGDILINNAAQSFFTINPPATGGLITMQMNGGAPNGMGLQIDGSNGIITEGDIFAGGNQTLFTIDDGNQTAEIGISSGVAPALWLDFANQDYAIGDFFGAGNNTNIEIDDNNQEIISTAGNGKFRINNGGFADFIFSGAGSKKFLFADPVNNTYQYGDINGKLNSTYFEIKDAVKRINMFIGTKSVFNFDQINGSYTMGDLGSAGNGMLLQIGDGATGTIDVHNTALNAMFVINGVNGFTGTVTPVNSITVNGGIVTNVT